ncbi:MAG: hypothetical protein ACR2QB_12185 [Gammaproteobacteria bacterium]
MNAGTQQADGLQPVTSLQEFFRDSVDSAMAANRVVLDEQASHYVVCLLTLFARSEDFYEVGEDGPQLRPLASMLADAADAPTDEARCFALQRVGDVALFIAGFFEDFLQRAPVDVGYYTRMGGSAYCTLSGSMRGTLRGRVMGEVFAELGAKFTPMVDVLNEVRDSARGTRAEDALRLYETWVRTGSPRAARLLREQGIHPLDSARSGYEH